QVRALGPTPEVVASYEAYVRARQTAGLQGTDPVPPDTPRGPVPLQEEPSDQAVPGTTGSSLPAPSARIEAVEVADLAPPPQGAPSGTCGRLASPDLRITVR